MRIIRRASLILPRFPSNSQGYGGPREYSCVRSLRVAEPGRGRPVTSHAKLPDGLPKGCIGSLYRGKRTLHANRRGG